VQKVKDNATSRTYAKNIYRISKSTDIKKAQETVLKEISIMKNLQEDKLPSYIRFIEFRNITAEQDSGFELLMEPVASDGSLKNFIAKIRNPPINTPYPELNPGDLFVSLLSGLYWIYKKNIRYRDIKPENILLYKDKPIFTDFRISLEFAEIPLSTT
jgi:serine/threonine protein kinase